MNHFIKFRRKFIGIAPAVGIVPTGMKFPAVNTEIAPQIPYLTGLRLNLHTLLKRVLLLRLCHRTDFHICRTS